jgi:fluoride ion exporter CrcB/FEX
MNLIVYFSMSWVKLGDLLNGYLGIFIIIIIIKEKEREKKNHFWRFHWVTGLLASLSIECSRQKVRNLNWLKSWLV